VNCGTYVVTRARERRSSLTLGRSSVLCAKAIAPDIVIDKIRQARVKHMTTRVVFEGTRPRERRRVVARASARVYVYTCCCAGAALRANRLTTRPAAVALVFSDDRESRRRFDFYTHTRHIYNIVARSSTATSTTSSTPTPRYTPLPPPSHT